MAIPGWLVYALLSEDRSFRLLIFGWALGYLLEVAAYLGAAAAGQRSLFYFYPVAIVGLAGGANFLRQRLARRPRPRSAGAPWSGSTAWPWTVAAIAIALVVYLGGVYFHLEAPLPGSVAKVNYNQDLVYQLSVAGEIRHHWPIHQPNVSGISLDYHLFANTHMAAASQVTGIPLPTILFRFFPISLAVLAVCSLSIAGSALTGRRWVGPVAALFLFFVGEQDLFPIIGKPFLGEMPWDTWSDPGFMFGLAFAIPALVLIAERTARLFASEYSPGPSRPKREWITLVLLLAGCAGAKAELLPVLGGGVGLYVLWRLIRTRRLEFTGLAVFALIAVIYAGFAYFVYGGETYGLTLRLAGAARHMPLFETISHHVSGSAALHAYWVGAGAFGLLMLCAALFACMSWFVGRGVFLRPVHQLLLFVFLAGLIPFWVTYSPNGIELAFLTFGILAGTIVAAEGLLRYLEDARRGGGLAGVWLVAFSWLWFVVALLSMGTRVIDQDTHEIRLFALLYGILLVSVLAFLIAGWRAKPDLRRARMALLVAAVVTTAMLDVPTDTVTRGIRGGGDKHPPTYVSSAPGLTPAKLAAYDWIRTHTSKNDVLALSNERTPQGKAAAPTDAYLSAFAERRVFDEAWAFTPQAAELGLVAVDAGKLNPFPARHDLQHVAFNNASAQALRDLYAAGVRYLVIDRKNGKSVKLLYRRTTIAYSNPAMNVLKLDPAKFTTPPVPRPRPVVKPPATGTTRPPTATTPLP